MKNRERIRKENMAIITLENGVNVQLFTHEGVLYLALKDPKGQFSSHIDLSEQEFEALESVMIQHIASSNQSVPQFHKKKKLFCFHNWNVFKQIKRSGVKDYKIVRTTKECRKCGKTKVAEKLELIFGSYD